MIQKTIPKAHDENNKNEIFKPFLSGLTWQYISVVFKGGFQLLVVGVLSRLLTPSDFGLMGIAFIFVNFASLVSEIGVGPAIVQRKDLTQSHIRVGFTSSFIFGFSIFLIIYLSSPLIAQFFDNILLVKIIRVLCLYFVFCSLGVISQSLLQRELKFKQLMWVDTLSYLIGYAGLGIALAYFGYGVWALVYAHLCQSGISIFISFLLRPYSTKPLLRKKEMKELIYFGFGFTLTQIFNYGANQGDYFVVGKLLGISVLGIYTRAYHLMLLPAHYIGNVFEKVLFPLASSIQENTERLKKLFLVNSYIIALTCAPLSAFMFLNADQIILFLLGPQWNGVIEPFKILSIGVLFRTAYKISDSVAKAKGAVYQRSSRELIYFILVVFSSLIGSRWGLLGVTWGVFFAILINFLLASIMSHRILNFTLKEYVSSFTPGFVFGLTILAVIYPFRLFLNQYHLHPIFILLLTSSVGVISLTFIILLHPRIVGSLGALTFKSLQKHVPISFYKNYFFMRIVHELNGYIV